MFTFLAASLPVSRCWLISVGISRSAFVFPHYSTIVNMGPCTPKSSTKAKGKVIKAVKRPKKVMTLQQKVEILNLLDGGMSYACCARKYSVNESTIRYIKKRGALVRSAVCDGASEWAKNTSYIRDEAVIKMEKALAVWMENANRRRIPMSQSFIREKAMSLYARFVPDNDTSHHFKASRGWFNNFRRRYGYHNVTMSGEAASADQEAAKEYPKTFADIVEEGGYLPEQVFNADETGLYWKKMPARTYISTAEKSAPGFKVAKDRFTMLLCGNAAGHMIKPMMIYRCEKPRALKNKDMNLLPVFYRHNKKCWMTGVLFMDWFHNHFVREAEKYLLKKGLPFKALLILDNCSSHPEAVKFASEHVQVIFLPKNTTSLLQPLDQGVIAVWKAKYAARTFQMIRETMDTCMDDNAISVVKKIWGKFTIADCISFIKETHDQITGHCVQKCWKSLWPELVVNDFGGFHSVDAEVRNILTLAREVGGPGFDDLTEDEVTDELLSAPREEELTEEELQTFVENKQASDDDGAEEEVPAFTLTSLNRCLITIKDAVTSFVDTDPSLERSVKLRSKVDEALMPYKQLLKELKRNVSQPPITMYLYFQANTPGSSGSLQSPLTSPLTSPDSPAPSTSSGVTVLSPDTLANPQLLRGAPPPSADSAPLSPSVSNEPSTPRRPIPMMRLDSHSDEEALGLLAEEEAHFSGFEDEDLEDADDPPVRE